MTEGTGWVSIIVKVCGLSKCKYFVEESWRFYWVISTRNDSVIRGVPWSRWKYIRQLRVFSCRMQNRITSRFFFPQPYTYFISFLSFHQQPFQRNTIYTNPCLLALYFSLGTSFQLFIKSIATSDLYFSRVTFPFTSYLQTADADASASLSLSSDLHYRKSISMKY